MDELKPCPFCGNGNLSVTEHNGFRVVCLYCFASGPESDLADNATMIWNKRTEEQ